MIEKSEAQRFQKEHLGGLVLMRRRVEETGNEYRRLWDIGIFRESYIFMVAIMLEFKKFKVDGDCSQQLRCHGVR